MKKIKLSGGYRFRNFQGQPGPELIEPEIPKRVVIPLKQGFGNEVLPAVKEGDRVTTGSVIGQNDSKVSSPVHSSITGIVRAIKRINYFKQDTTMVEIEGLGPEETCLLPGHSENWEKLDVEELKKLIYLSGVSALDREGIPTGNKSSIITPEEAENLIIHGVGSEMFNLNNAALLDGKKIFQFIEGVKILRKIMPKAVFHLVLNKDEIKLVENLAKLTAPLPKLEIILTEPKYPIGYDEILVPTVLGKKFPYGYSAASIGVVVLNIQAVLKVAEAVILGRPLIERTIALAGNGFIKNLHLKVRVGTPLEEIIRPYLKSGIKTRLVLNSLLTGLALPDLTLPLARNYTTLIAIEEQREREAFYFFRPGLKKSSYSNTFLSKFIPNIEKEYTTGIGGERRACVSCGFCEEVCPVQIIPHLLYKYISGKLTNEILIKYGIFNCIECGLCSYVCPSKINLVKYIKEGQESLINQGCDRSMCILPYFDLKGLAEYRGIK